MTEKEKCRNGLLYNPNYDPELQREMLQAADLCFRYNNLPPSAVQEREALLAAGAVVTKDVPARTVVAGVPAKIVKEL